MVRWNYYFIFYCWDISYPHNTYCAFVHGVVYILKCNYVMQTIESVGSLFQPLEEVANSSAFYSGWDPCCKLERDLLSLPCQLWGLHIPILPKLVIISFLHPNKSVLLWFYLFNLWNVKSISNETAAKYSIS